MANTKDIRGTRTEKCLVAAYVSESTAYTRYTYYAQQADKEQYFPIGEIFRETAANELHHGKVFFRMLQGGKVDVALNVDAGIIGTTAQNLEIASAEELAEGVEQYKNSAKVADEEGFPEIADHFRAIAAVEESHRRRFDRYLRPLPQRGERRHGMETRETGEMALPRVRIHLRRDYSAGEMPRLRPSLPALHGNGRRA